MVYAAQSLSLCVLEVLANSSKLPVNCAAIEIQIPNRLAVASVEITELPIGWNNPEPCAETKDIGTKWVLAESTAVLAVPSSIIPTERNYLLNPRHSDFAQIQFDAPRLFYFDSRLK